MTDRFVIDVSDRDPWDPDDRLPPERPSLSEVLDPPERWVCGWCGATGRDYPEDRCERCVDCGGGA